MVSILKPVFFNAGICLSPLNPVLHSQTHHLRAHATKYYFLVLPENDMVGGLGINKFLVR